jgi:hypothetical protein
MPQPWFWMVRIGDGGGCIGKREVEREVLRCGFGFG